MSHKTPWIKIKTKFESNNDTLISQEQDYKNAGTKLQYICSIHSNIIQQVDWHNYSRGHRCSYCAKHHKPTLNEVKKAFESKNYTLLSTEYLGNKQKLKFICNKHSDVIQETTWNYFFDRLNQCKICQSEHQTERQRTITYEDIKIALEAEDYIFLTLKEDWIDTTKTKIICHCPNPNHSIWITDWAGWRTNIRCPQCAYNRSKGEEKIHLWLKQHIPNYEGLMGIERQKKFDDLIDKGHLSYDFYLETFNLLIEYQGAFHDHSVKFQTADEFICSQKHDKMKADYAKEHNIELLEIWYWDFDKIEEILSKKLLGV